jgi:hypothetical protein
LSIADLTFLKKFGKIKGADISVCPWWRMGELNPSLLQTGTFVNAIG